VPSKNLDTYLRKFTKLRVDRSRGVAPHKPILLLSVIELIEQGILRENRIELSPELIAAFLKYWGKIGSDAHHSEIAMPFFHLRSERFWHLQPNPGFEATLASRVRVKTIAGLRDAVECAFLDDELFELLQNGETRRALVGALITGWFADKRDEVRELLRVNYFEEIAASYRQEGGRLYAAEEIRDEGTFVVRDAAFRRTIVSIYDYRCALCELRAIDCQSRHIVDGAHIKPFSQFHDDQVNNGLSLCKNHHWAFDRGWFGVDDRYRAVVSGHLHEDSRGGRRLADFHGQPILVPEQERYIPRLEAIQWHRENRFIG